MSRNEEGIVSPDTIANIRVGRSMFHRPLTRRHGRWLHGANGVVSRVGYNERTVRSNGNPEGVVERRGRSAAVGRPGVAGASYSRNRFVSTDLLDCIGAGIR